MWWLTGSSNSPAATMRFACKPTERNALMKRCAYCGQQLPLDNFYQDKLGTYAARCKACHGIAVRSCVQCGVPFVGKSGAKLCSAECRKAYRPRTHKVCASCGVLFPVAHLRRRFCSYRCKVKAQTTGRTM